MNRCSWRDWVEHVRQAYLDVASRCERVFVAGESMGALLTLYLGAEYLGIAGLITYAPALRAASWRPYQALLLQFFVQVRENDRTEEDPDSIVDQRWQGYTGYPVPAVVQLLALQRQVKRRLPRIEQPLLVFQGRLDTSIDIRGAEQVIARVNSRDKELVWLAESTHCIILDVERETAAERTAAFIQRVEGRS
jgi:carboxylesterase